MMSVYRRNILVGTVVLGALAVIVWMILRFGQKTSEFFTPPQMIVHFTANRADGLSEGSPVFYLGVGVGRIINVRLNPDKSGVQIDSTVDRDLRIPGNVSAEVRQTGLLGGSAAIFLDLAGAVPSPQPLPDNAALVANFGNDPSTEITQMSRQIARTVEALRDSGVIPDLDATIRQINDQAGRMGKLIDSVNQTVSNPQTQENINHSIASLRTALDAAPALVAKLDKVVESVHQNSAEVSQAIHTSQGHVDDLAKSLDGRLEQIAGLLKSVQSVADKLDNGKGTAGQLINDPRLYTSLVEMASQLSATVTDLHRLVDQWEQEGVSLKLK